MNLKVREYLFIVAVYHIVTVNSYEGSADETFLETSLDNELNVEEANYVYNDIDSLIDGLEKLYSKNKFKGSLPSTMTMNNERVNDFENLSASINKATKEKSSKDFEPNCKRWDLC